MLWLRFPFKNLESVRNLQLTTDYHCYKLFSKQSRSTDRSHGGSIVATFSEGAGSIMPSYILRTIDPELWVRVKARADREGLPLRALILALLRAYADGHLSVSDRQVTQQRTPPE